MLDSLTDKQIGDFVLHEMVERRASMALYRATQQTLKRFVLVKVIELKSLPLQKDALQIEFLDFTRRVVTLEFMHLQPIYDFGIIGEDYIYIAGRFMAGNLHELLESGALPLDRALELTSQIVRSVVFVHAQGLIHSSLSPRNVYIDEAHNCYINDLELSMIVQAAHTTKDLKQFLDEPFYTSVEQLQLQPIDFRSEVYSIGAIVYHMLTGSAPFSDGADDFESVLQRKIRNQVVPPRRLNPQIPVQLEKLVLRALRADPAERFPDLASLEAALKPQLHQVEPGGGSLRNRIEDLLRRIRSS